MNALGRWLQLNPKTVKRHTVSTWRLAGRGDLLGHTLVVDGNAVVVGVVNEKSSGANLAPAPSPAEQPRHTLAEVTAWSLPEALELIERGEVTERELNGLYRAAGGSPKVTWLAYTDTEELVDPGEPVAGVYVACGAANGTVPLDKVLTGQPKIMLQPADLYAPEKLAPHPARQDGMPELSTAERLRLIVDNWDPL